MAKRIILIDGNNYLFSSQHANPVMMAGEQETTAVFGMLGQIRHLAECFPDSQMIFLWDKTPTWRNAEYPDYKANRSDDPEKVKMKERVKSQRSAIKSIFKVMGIAQCEHPGMEADDLAGYLAPKLAEKTQVILATNDRDWIQLVNENVCWYANQTGKMIYDLDFTEETGFRNPSAFVLGKAIQGDASDNIRGIPGLGEVAAGKLAARFDTAEGLLVGLPNLIEEIQQEGSKHELSRTRNKLIALAETKELQDRLRLNVRLMDLRVQKPTGVKVERGAFDLDGIKEQFRALSFQSLLNDFDRWAKPFYGDK